MTEETPIEAYQAFACTKPTEFDAFMRRWKEEHPICTLITDKQIAALYTEEEKNRTVGENLEAINKILLPVEDVKKTKGRPKLAAPATSTTDTVSTESQ